MEPPLKRPRLFEPDKSEPSIAYDSDNYSDLYDDEDTPLEVEEDGQEEDDDNDDDEHGDPDVQLEQTRAQLDLKLKSKFEAIFEKYGRDFTGIGDEIDLRTGEIVIDNGHLLEMENERDDGTGRPSLLAAFTQEPDETVGSTDAEEDEHDEVHESHVKLEDMEEDDMILFQNSAVPSDRPETPPPRSALVLDLQSDQEEDGKISPATKTSYPSESEILAQFGQELGPKIARYVSQQRAQGDSVIEPVWRTPGLPLATPGKRPILKSILLQPDSDRSPSPKGSSSVWAPKMPRGRPRRDGADIAAVFRGETIIHDRTWYSSGYVSTTVTKQRTERVGLSQSKRTIGVPLNEMLTAGKSKLKSSPWAQSRQSESGDIYGINPNSDQELDSSEEKVAKFYKPRRSWSNPGFHVKQRASGNLTLQSSQSRHKGKDGISSRGSRAPYVPFTEADDEELLEWVEEALKKGFALWSPAHWKMLAAKNPRHSHLSWMDRYRRRFWQKGVIPSIGKENPGEALGTGAEESQVVHQIVCDSQSELEEYSSSGESSNEMVQDTPLTRSGNVPENIFSQRVPGQHPKVDAIDLEVLDPALRPPLEKDCTKREAPDSLWQQGLKLSQSPVLDFKRGASVPCIASDYMSAVGVHRSSSVPQKLDFRAQSVSFSSQEVQWRNHKATDIDIDVQKVPTEDNKTIPSVESRQVMLSAEAGMLTKGANTQQQIPPKPFDSSYDFSDDEDGTESVQACRPFRLQVPDEVSRHSVKKQIIDLTIEDSAPADNITSDWHAYKSSSHNRPQAPVSISSSSSVSDLSDFEEEKFFLEPTTPKASVPDSNMTLSGILESDDFEELCKSSPVSSKQSPQAKMTVSASQEVRNNSFNGARPRSTRNPTPKRRTPIGTTRASILRRSMEASPTGPMIETPGGSKRRCGENGFTCGRGFCFKCLEG